MASKGSGLAARFRKALQSEKEARRQAEEAEERRLAEARAARAQLFDDLVEFAEATGFVTAQRDEGVTLRWRMRYVHFEPTERPDGVRIEFEGAPDEEHALYRESQLDHRWVWVARRRGREDRMPFFDQGLEELLVRALGLPRPDGGAEGEDGGEGRRRL